IYVLCQIFRIYQPVRKSEHLRERFQTRIHISTIILPASPERPELFPKENGKYRRMKGICKHKIRISDKIQELLRTSAHPDISEAFVAGTVFRLQIWRKYYLNLHLFGQCLHCLPLPGVVSQQINIDIWFADQPFS